MKKMLLFTATLLSMSSHASFFGFLNSNPAIANVLSNSSNIQFGNGQSGGIVESSTEQQCTDAVHTAIQAQKDEPNELGLLSAANLLYSASHYSLNGDYTQEHKSSDYFGKQIKRGLANGTNIRVNSYSSKYIPHEISGCSKLAEVTSVTQSLIENKTCRVVNYDMSGENYKIIFCENDQTVYTDFLDIDSKTIKTYKEIK